MNLSHPTTTARLRRLTLAIAMSSAGLLGATLSTSAEALTYAIAIDTRTIAGAMGTVDLLWNVGVADPSMVASVSSFSGALLDGAPLLYAGNVTGSYAPGSVLRFAGSAGGDYIYQPLTFGSTIRFDLTLPDTAAAQPGQTFGSVFSVGLFGTDQQPLLPANPVDGTSLDFSFAPGMAPVLTTFGPVSVSTVSPVPEPSTYLLSLVGLIGIAVYRHRMQRRWH